LSEAKAQSHPQPTAKPTPRQTFVPLLAVLEQTSFREMCHAIDDATEAIRATTQPDGLIAAHHALVSAPARARANAIARGRE
jgi:hypothetical protein